MKLDRSRDFGTVEGDYFGARFYQDSHYFSTSGDYLFSNPGVAPPAGAKASITVDEHGPVGDPLVDTEAAEAPAEQPAVAQAENLTREQSLAQQDVPALRALVAVAGGDPITGSGAKARMIAWLLANTQ